MPDLKNSYNIFQLNWTNMSNGKLNWNNKKSWLLSLIRKRTEKKWMNDKQYWKVWIKFSEKAIKQVQ